MRDYGTRSSCGTSLRVTTLAKAGRLKEALRILDLIDRRDAKAYFNAYTSLLQACIDFKALAGGKLVYAHIIKTGFKPNIVLGNKIVHMYAKCGNALNARQVFDQMPERNLFTWTIMISGYANNGYAVEALKLFHKMELRGMKPDAVTLVSILKACTNLRDFQQGKQLHAYILKGGFLSDLAVGNSLIHMYVKCGGIAHAHQVFREMPSRDVISWSVIIGGYAQYGHNEEALKLFRQMQVECVNPNGFTFVSILKTCANMADLEKGKEVHAYIMKCGFGDCVFVGSTLVDMYAKCGSIELARQVFDSMLQRNVVSWTTMIAGYVQHGNGEEGLKLFKQMKQEGMMPDKVTFVSILNACSVLADLEQGKEVHAQVIRCGFQSDVFVRSTLLDMYIKCGSIDNARQVFDEISDQCVVSWTLLIAGYVQLGCSEEALKLFRRMQQEAVKPNELTFVNVINACANLVALEQGKQVHVLIRKSRFESDVFVGSSLIDMYVKCGSIKHARQVFDKMSKRNVVSWTAMIAGYAHHGHGEEALILFDQMQYEGVKPDAVAFVSALKACASLAVLEQGKQIHSDIIKSGFEFNVFVQNSLVDMYAKCGSIELARQVFDKTSKRDAVTWTAMIAGYSQHGAVEKIVQLVEQMQLEGVKLDHIIFIGLLSACSHTGLVDEGWQYFLTMNQSYGIRPGADHYACMVDLLGRAGYLEEAEDFIKIMPFPPSIVVWRTMLNACRIHGNIKLAKRAAECALELEPGNEVAPLLLSNIYVAADN